MIDLGKALLKSDYEKDILKGSQFYGDKGRSMDLWGKLGGYAGSGLATLFGSLTLSPPVMAMINAAMSAGGSMLGSELAGAQYGDYEGDFAYDTIQGLGQDLETQQWQDALMGGITKGAGSFKAGLGAGKEAMGAIDDETYALALENAMEGVTNDPSLISFEHGILGKDFSEWGDHAIYGITEDGTKIDATSVYHSQGPANLIANFDKYKDVVDWSYEFTDHAGASFDPEWMSEMYEQLSIGQQRGVGREYMDNWLQGESLRNVGIDPMAVGGYDADGNPLSNSLIFSQSKDAEHRLNFLMENYQDRELNTIYEMGAKYGIDPTTGLYYDEDTFEIESIGKRWQDIKNQGGFFGGGWEKSGGLSGFFGGEESPFGIGFEDPSDSLPHWDPDLNGPGQGGWVYPTPKPAMNPLAWMQEHPWLTAGGGLGLLSLLTSLE